MKNWVLHLETASSLGERELGVVVVVVGEELNYENSQTATSNSF